MNPQLMINSTQTCFNLLHLQFRADLDKTFRKNGLFFSNALFSDSILTLRSMLTYNVKFAAYLGYFILLLNGYNYGVADLKSSYLYENLPVLKKMAILSRRPVLLAIMLYQQFKHHTQINLRPNKQLLSTQQHAYKSCFSYFLLLFRLRHRGMLGEF